MAQEEVQTGPDSVPVDEMTPAQLRAHITGLSTTLAQMQASPETPESSSRDSTPSNVPPGGETDARAEELAARLAAENRISQPSAQNMWSGTNITQLRQDQSLTGLADQLLARIMERAPFLQQNHPGGAQQLGGSQHIPGGGQQLGGFQNPVGAAAHLPGQFLPPAGDHRHMPLPGIQQNTAIINTIGNTKLYNEHYPHLYLTPSSHTKAMDSNTINMPNYVLGYIKFLLSVVQGKQAAMSADEFEARLQNLHNILQVVVTNSSNSEYNDRTWSIAREYSNRIMKDLEEGSKNWKSMGPGMQTDAYIFSKDAINAASKEAPKPTKSSQKSTCYSYNNVSNEDQKCAFEVANPGKRCHKTHACSHCLYSINKFHNHRAMECEKKKRGGNDVPDPFQNGGSDQ